MDDFFYWLSKAFWLLASPDSVLVLLAVLGTILLYAQQLKWAKRCFTLLTASLLFIAIVPLGHWLLIPLETKFPSSPELPSKVDGIIVLSGPEEPLQTDYWQLPSLGGAAERNLAFMALAKQYPKAKLVFSGGGAFTEPHLTQAHVAHQMFKQQGFDTERVIFEDRSRNTVENVNLSYPLAQPKPGENWLMVTSAFHMSRSVGLFCARGWPVIPYPVDHRTLPGKYSVMQWKFGGNLQLLSLALREWIGLSAYYWWGKTNAWLPAQCAKLDPNAS